MVKGVASQGHSRLWVVAAPASQASAFLLWGLSYLVPHLAMAPVHRCMPRGPQCTGLPNHRLAREIP